MSGEMLNPAGDTEHLPAVTRKPGHLGYVAQLQGTWICPKWGANTLWDLSQVPFSR